MNGKIFNMEKEQFIKLYVEKKSIAQIVKTTGYGFDSIRGYMKRNNIPLKFKTTYSCDEDFFSRDDEQSFYWAGFIAADGCVQEKKRDYPFVLKLTIASKDKPHLELFKKNINSNSPIKKYIIHPNKLIKTTNQSSEIIIYSKKMCQDLKRFNVVPRKSLIINFPVWLIDHPLVNHFLRGYIDGDGSFSNSRNKNTIQCTMNILGTYQFLTNVYQIIDKNIGKDKFERKISNKGKVYSIGYSGNKMISRVFDFLYQDATIYLDRKYQKSISSKFNLGK